MFGLIKRIKAIIRDKIRSYQYVLIVPAYQGVHYCWNMYQIDEWILCYGCRFKEIEYLIYSPYAEEPIRGKMWSGKGFINGL